MSDIVVFEKNSVIIKEGDSCDSLYLVKSGKIAIFKEEKGRLFFFPFIEKQEFIGNLNVFDGSTHQFGAVALERSEAFKIPIRDIDSVLKDCPDWVNEIMATMADRLANAMHLSAEHKINVNEETLYSEELEARVRKLLN